jgi:hypothetical protein
MWPEPSIYIIVDAGQYNRLLSMMIHARDSNYYVLVFLYTATCACMGCLALTHNSRYMIMQWSNWILLVYSLHLPATLLFSKWRLNQRSMGGTQSMQSGYGLNRVLLYVMSMTDPLLRWYCHAICGRFYQLSYNKAGWKLPSTF